MSAKVLIANVAVLGLVEAQCPVPVINGAICLPEIESQDFFGIMKRTVDVSCRSTLSISYSAWPMSVRRVPKTWLSTKVFQLRQKFHSRKKAAQVAFLTDSGL